MTELKLVFTTSRPVTSLVSGLAMFIILFRDPSNPIWVDGLQSVPIVLATMIGFILNDIYDYKKDSQGKLLRPIAMGLLDRGRAGIYAFFLSLMAIAIEGVLNQFGSVDVLIATLLGVRIYSPLSKRVPVVKGLATAGLTLTPVVYASAVLGRSVPTFIYVSIVIFIVGREILLDIKDFQRDISYGIKTLVAYLGFRASRVMAWLLMFAGIVYYMLMMNNPYGNLLIGLGIVCLILACIRDWKQEVINGGITLLAMIFCILAIPFSL